MKKQTRAATAAMLAGTFHVPLFDAIMILKMTNNLFLPCVTTSSN